VFYHSVSLRCVFVSFVAAAALLIASAPAQAGDCQTALGSSTGFVSLSNAGTTTKQKGVDEWENEVVKVTTVLPGVLTITGSGARSHSAVFSAGATTPHPRIDTARLGTGARSLQAVVKAGNHCIEVAPPNGATGNFTIDVTFTDVCHLGDLDDHGDSFLCATALTVGGGSVSGQVTSSGGTDDSDVFSFTLGSSATVAIASSGSTDVQATLYSADGTIIATDDNGGSSPNFSITQSLATGSYGVTVATVP
jgi:hypothetical protein